jgi:CubicO group peptidase (beta-lactamase class C family)
MTARIRNVFVRVALVGLAATQSNAAVPDAAEVARRADAYLQARAESGTFNGTVLLARGGTVLFVKGYGFADEARQLRNSATTRFPIASITKTFTAALIMSLRREGRLALEDPVCKHLAPCPAHWQPVTVRHLLTHTAGIPDYARAAEFPGKMGERRTTSQLIAEFRERPLDFAPGAKYAYSNSGYVLLGAILEKAGGRSYAELLDRRIFAPLGMRNSGLEGRAGTQVDLATGYRPHGARNAPADFVDPSWLFSAGAIYSSVHDLHAWSQALRSGLPLTRDEVAAMWSAEHASYGFGWQLLAPSPQSLGRRLVFHAGGTTGFATDLLIYPDDDVTVIILANLLPVPLAEISRDLSAMVFGEKYATPPVRRAAKIDPAVFADYVGVYQLAPNVKITVSREGDQLAVQATGQQRDIAVPESVTTFYSRISPVRLSFARDGTGKVTRLVLHEPNRDLTAPRL